MSVSEAVAHLKQLNPGTDAQDEAIDALIAAVQEECAVVADRRAQEWAMCLPCDHPEFTTDKLDARQREAMDCAVDIRDLDFKDK